MLVQRHRDTANRSDDAPPQVVFDGTERLGQFAVPVNMLILGASRAELSSFEWGRCSAFADLQTTVSTLFQTQKQPDLIDEARPTLDNLGRSPTPTTA